MSTSTRQTALAGLAARAARPDGRRITPLFAADPERARRFSASLDDLILDYSKSAIDAETLDALFALAEAADLEGFRRRLFAGEMVNATEHRAAMHMALRSPREAGLKAALAGGIDDASRLAAAERDRMRSFVTAIHEGSQRGATGERLTTVVNIGIGGSDLGPRVATEALTIGRTDARMEARFLSNVDGHAFQATVQGLDPARTLFLVASKTFTTLETRTNAAAARAWIAEKLGEAAVGRHFAALSTNLKAVGEFGIAPERTFGFRDWVGGRYSLWSPVGLVIALAVGWEKFQALLDGAWAMDCHFRDAPLRQNLPVLLGLVGIWNVNALGCATHCVLAYDDRLRRLPAHLQQLEMESNGKHVTLAGSADRVGHLPDPVRRARHQRAAQLHAAGAPGHTAGAGGFHPRRQSRSRPGGGASRAGRQRLRAGRGVAARSAGGGDQGGDGGQGRVAPRRSMPWRRTGCASASGRRTPFCSAIWMPSVWGG